MRLPATVPSLVSVESSNVEAVGYDPKKRYLYIKFLPSEESYRGSVYRYSNVKEQIFNRLLSSASKGMFVWAHIRDKYPYAKWTGFGWRKQNTLQKMSIQKKNRKKRFKKTK
jgi:hypothetical protein